MVLIIFAWTPPHFWALAIDRKEEYRKVNVPMLPVTHGDKYTKLHILLLYSNPNYLFCPALCNWDEQSFYLSSAVALGVGFIYWSLLMIFSHEPNAPFDTFRYSIFLSRSFVHCTASGPLLLSCNIYDQLDFNMDKGVRNTDFFAFRFHGSNSWSLLFELFNPEAAYRG